MENKKEYNPTVAAFFDAPVFGRDATEETPDKMIAKIETKSGKRYIKEIGTAFQSVALNQDALSALSAHAKLGSRLLLRQAGKLAKNGARTFYLEIMPPDDGSWKRNTGNTESDV